MSLHGVAEDKRSWMFRSREKWNESKKVILNRTMRKGRCTKYSLFTAGIKFDLIDTKHRSEIKKKEKIAFH